MEASALAKLKERLFSRRAGVSEHVAQTTGRQLEGKRRQEATTMLTEAQERLSDSSDISEIQKELASRVVGHQEEQFKDRFKVGGEKRELILELERFGKLQAKLAEKYPGFFEINEKGKFTFNYDSFDKLGTWGEDLKLNQEILKEITAGISGLLERVNKLAEAGEDNFALDLFFKEMGEKQLGLVYLDSLVHLSPGRRGHWNFSSGEKGAKDFRDSSQIYDALIHNFNYFQDTDDVLAHYLRVEDRLIEAQSYTFGLAGEESNLPFPTVISDKIINKTSWDKKTRFDVQRILTERLRRQNGGIKLRKEEGYQDGATGNDQLLYLVSNFINKGNILENDSANYVHNFLAAAGAFGYEKNSPKKAETLTLIVRKIFEYQVLPARIFVEQKDGTNSFPSEYSGKDKYEEFKLRLNGDSKTSLREYRPLKQIIFSLDFPAILDGIKQAVEEVSRENFISLSSKKQIVQEICSGLIKSWQDGEGGHKPYEVEGMLRAIESAKPVFESLADWQRSVNEEGK